MTTNSERPQQPVRLAIVNDYEIVVAGIAAVLAPFSDRVAVVEIAAGLRPYGDVDVILYDTFAQPQGGAIDVQGLVHDCSAKVVAFSWNVDRDAVTAALEAGASGYVSKGLAVDELVAALERINAGETVSPVSEDMPEGYEIGSWPGADHGLTARESEILALITQGFSNVQVGERAFIGINTVKTHIRLIYRKIEVESRSQAILWGYAHGFGPDRLRADGPDAPPAG